MDQSQLPTTPSPAAPSSASLCGSNCADACQCSGRKKEADPAACTSKSDAASDQPTATTHAVREEISAIQIVSDLHLEFMTEEETENFRIEPRSEVLALIGDIAPLSDEEQVGRLRGLLQRCADSFKYVFMVAGNHEYYNNTLSMEVTDEQLRQLCASITSKQGNNNVTFLQKTSLLLPTTAHGNIRVLGCTLWSHIPDEMRDYMEKIMNDYHVIQSEPRVFLTAARSSQIHQDHVAWLRQEIAQAAVAKERVLVLTHHSPVIEANHPEEEELLSACCTDLRDMLQPPVFLWGFGHTHYCYDTNFNGTTRVVANCKGYPYEETGWNPTIEYPLTYCDCGVETDAAAEAAASGKKDDECSLL